MLAAAISNKVEAENFRAAVRLLYSEETVTASTDETYEALKTKHPAAPSDPRPAAEFKGNKPFTPLQVSSEDVIKDLKTFPVGSSGGPDGLTAQHLSDLLAGAPNEQLKTNLTDFVNVVLQGDLPAEVREIFFGGRLITLQKKDGEYDQLRLVHTQTTCRKMCKCIRHQATKR